jgi:hypothetical protein
MILEAMQRIRALERRVEELEREKAERELHASANRQPNGKPARKARQARTVPTHEHDADV